MASHRFQNPPTMPPTRGYSHVAETKSPSRTIYIAGQLGMTADGKFAGAPAIFAPRRRSASRISSSRSPPRERISSTW